MKLFGLGVPELVIILIVVLIIFGPKNLPKLGAAVGKATKNLRDGMGAGKKKKAEAEAAAAEAEAATAEAPAEEIAVEAEELPSASETVSYEEAAPKKRVVKVVKKAE